MAEAYFEELNIIRQRTKAIAALLILAANTVFISEVVHAEVCTITVTESNVTVNGTPDADVICVLGDYNTILTGAGDDQVIDEGIGNTIFLGEGNDGYTGPGGGGGIVDGGPGNDTITGTPGDDVIDGGSGDDALIGGFGDDSLSGGDGADNLSGDAGADNLSGDMGPDIIDGGDGSDTLNGGGGDDQLVGGSYDDIIQAGEGNDSLVGNDGNDQLFGDAGSDNLNGNSGDDVVVGGADVDLLDGGGGVNKCDYSSSEIRTSTCLYDDFGPEIVELTFSSASWDSTEKPVDVAIHLATTDDTGFMSGRILCFRPATTDSPQHIATDVRIAGTQVSTVGFASMLTSSESSGSLLNLSINSTVRLNQGTPPGSYICDVNLLDSMNNRTSRRMDGAFVISRGSGSFDDQAPTVTVDLISPQPIDSAGSAKMVRVVFHADDDSTPLQGQFECSMNINGNWYQALHLTWSDPSSIYSYADNRSTAPVSLTKTRVDFDVSVTIPQDTMPGDYSCGGHQTDSIGNHVYRGNLATFTVVNTSLTRDYNPPVVLDGAASPNIVDVGREDQMTVLSWRITDATAMNYGWVACRSGQNQILDAIFNSGMIQDYGGRVLTPTISGTLQNMLYVLPLKIPFGTYPGVYTCNVSVSDTLQQWMGYDFTSVVVDRTPPGMPQAPTNLAFVSDPSRPSDGVLSWSPPTDLGSPALYDYEVELSLDGVIWTALADPLSASTTRTLSNLRTATDYQFRVRGNNGGNGITGSPGATWSQPLLVRTLDPIAPTAPSGVSATNIGSTSATVSWNVPAYHGGSSVTDYKVEVSGNGGTTWSEVPHNPSTSTSMTVSGLLPGNQYIARIRAKNVVGYGDFAEGQFATPATTPSKPLNLAASNVTSSSLTLSWGLPSSSGGSSIADYRIEFSSNAGSTWNTIAHSPSTMRSFNVSGLYRASTYLFRVSAVNGVGTGSPSDQLSVTTPASVPSSPTSLSVTSVTTTSASLAWIAPTDNGGSVLTDYRIETSRDSGATWTEITHPPSTNTLMTLSGMAPGTTYFWRVRAMNGIGLSAIASSQVTTNPDVPSAVAGLSTSSIGTTTATLTWGLPASNGGAPITDYRIEVSSDGTRFTAISHTASISRSFQVTGLAAGTAYWFRVSAINRIGAGPTSPVLRIVTVGNPPSAPTALSVKLASGAYSLSWKASTVSGGSAVRDYLVEYSLDGGTTWVRVVKPVSTSTSLKLSTLLTRTTYRFRVFAVNDVGPSPASSVLTFTTA